MDTIKAYAKAIVALVLPVLVTVIADIADVLQTSDDQWIRLLGTAIITAYGVWQVPNTAKGTAGLPSDVTAP